MDFKLRPKKSAQDLLNLVPGLITAQHAGGGKAEQIFLRGFDADHGTDVHISVDGIPVNMVSHAHGQGYADLHFVMPETIEGILVQKGPYYAANGDFSTAGSIKFKTIDKTDQNIFAVEGGSFGTTRIFGIMNIPVEIPSSSLYIAGEYARTDGYFDNKQGFNRYNFFGKFYTQLSDVSNLKFTASAFKSDWNASGQVPERALKGGIIDRFGSIDNSGGITFKLKNGFEGNLRCIHVSSRPADENNSVVARGSTLFDMALSYPVGIFNLGISIENIFNIEWNEAQFDTESKLKNETEPVSELHFTPGHPRMFKATLSLSF